jgi:hypothetical protein
VIPGKTRYKHDLMACLDVFSQDDTPNKKVAVKLDTKDSLSCCMFTFPTKLTRLTM